MVKLIMNNDERMRPNIAANIQSIPTWDSLGTGRPWSLKARLKWI